MPFLCSPEELNRFGKALEQDRLERFLHEYLPYVPPFPRVRELFERLHADGRRLVLAASAKEQEIKHYKAWLGIADRSEMATSADDTATLPTLPRSCPGGAGRVKQARSRRSHCGRRYALRCPGRLLARGGGSSAYSAVALKKRKGGGREPGASTGGGGSVGTR